MRNFLNIPSEKLYFPRQVIEPLDRANLLNTKPKCIWLTGLSGAGKSTIANQLDINFHTRRIPSFTLDGDDIRSGLCKDLSMSKQDRNENIRRVGEVAKLMTDAGINVICATISPYISDRRFVRSLFDDGQFIEVYLSTPLSVCEERDPKGLYKKARQGIIKNFTGVDGLYETPNSAEIVINTSKASLNECTNLIIDELL